MVVSAVVPVVPGVEGFLEFAMAGISSNESVRSTCEWRAAFIQVVRREMAIIHVKVSQSHAKPINVVQLCTILMNREEKTVTRPVLSP